MVFNVLDKASCVCAIETDIIIRSFSPINILFALATLAVVFLYLIVRKVLISELILDDMGRSSYPEIRMPSLCIE